MTLGVVFVVLLIMGGGRNSNGGLGGRNFKGGLGDGGSLDQGNLDQNVGEESLTLLAKIKQGLEENPLSSPELNEWLDRYNLWEIFYLQCTKSSIFVDTKYKDNFLEWASYVKMQVDCGLAHTMEITSKNGELLYVIFVDSPLPNHAKAIMVRVCKKAVDIHYEFVKLVWRNQDTLSKKGGGSGMRVSLDFDFEYIMDGLL